MNKQRYDEVVQTLTEDRKKVSEGKREDYTRGSEDVLANFKNQAEALGVDPKVSLAVHMEKQFSAVLNYIKTDGESESEPIIKRIGDTINYLELLWGLINEKEDDQLNLFREKAKHLYSYTPDEAFLDHGKLKEQSQKLNSFVKGAGGGSFELQEDIDGLGKKGKIIDTPFDLFEWIPEGAEKTHTTNVRADSRFKRCE